MSDRIGGRPSGASEMPTPGTGETPKALNKQPAEASSPDATATAANAPKDLYERQLGGQVQSKLQTRLQAMPGRASAAKVNFTSADLAYLAQVFAALIVQNPGADRLKRARLFARAILKRSRVRHMFAGVTEPEMEEMCTAIAEILDGSPVFGQLVDNVTEGTGKLG